MKVHAFWVSFTTNQPKRQQKQTTLVNHRRQTYSSIRSPSPQPLFPPPMATTNLPLSLPFFLFFFLFHQVFSSSSSPNTTLLLQVRPSSPLSDLLPFSLLEFSLTPSSDLFPFLRMSWRRSRWRTSWSWITLKSPDWRSLGLGLLTDTSSESESASLTTLPNSPMQSPPGRSSGDPEPIWVLFSVKSVPLLCSTPSNWMAPSSCDSLIPIFLPCYCRYDDYAVYCFSFVWFRWITCKLSISFCNDWLKGWDFYLFIYFYFAESWKRFFFSCLFRNYYKFTRNGFFFFFFESIVYSFVEF